MNRIAFATGWVVVFLGITELTALGQSTEPIEMPMFRPRTDAMATRDADAIRERLKALSDSRGPINPLGDYVKPKTARVGVAPKDQGRESLDEEANRIPSLDPEAQRRLKAQPPSVAENERYTIGLYPPPQFGSSADGAVRWSDDGFRPVESVPLTSVPVGGYVVRSNYQVGDPASMIPPSLGGAGTLPSYSAPPMGLPPITAPPMSAPPIPPPSIGAPPIGAPATVYPPGGSYGGTSSGIPIVGAPGTNVMPAPPAYVVPGPSPSYPPPVSSAPYAPATPTYSRSSGTVNSLPFVSAPPQARDARWMVSPEVYRRMEGATCATPTPAWAGAATGGVSGGSPFFYAPPVAMPMPTPRTASRHSWLHPFRH